MADVHDKKTRSKNMSKIRGKNTKPEMIVRRFLHSNGFRYRLHDKRLPGKPDIVLPKYKTVVEVQGCSWHGHPGCKFNTISKTNKDFWVQKIADNKLRDEKNKKKLIELGWNVIIIWADCKLQPKRKYSELREQTLNNLIKEIKVGNTNH